MGLYAQYEPEGNILSVAQNTHDSLAKSHYHLSSA
jgi:hypothetical protein